MQEIAPRSGDVGHLWLPLLFGGLCHMTEQRVNSPVLQDRIGCDDLPESRLAVRLQQA